MIKADTRHTMKNPGACPGCHNYDCESETDGHDGTEGKFVEISRRCHLCGCRWSEIMPTLPVEVVIEREPVAKWCLEDGLYDPESPVGKHLRDL